MFRRLMLLLGLLGALATGGAAALWGWRERRRRRRAARRAARQAARAAGRGSTPLPPVVIPVAKAPAPVAVPSPAAAPPPAVPVEGPPDPGADSGAPPADDLRAIRGIGAVAEERLHELGISRWDQIAAWSPDDVAAMAGSLHVSAERVNREDWVGQAQALVASRPG